MKRIVVNVNADSPEAGVLQRAARRTDCNTRAVALHEGGGSLCRRLEVLDLEGGRAGFIVVLYIHSFE